MGQILDERAYDQARAILESLREDLAKVVVTDAYQKAAKALDTCGFVLLLGEPAAGKTTIASLLAMAAVDQWQASVLKLDDPGKVVDHWNPQEPSQFFWLDDAFGVQQYEHLLVHRWNHALSQVRTGGQVTWGSTNAHMTKPGPFWNRCARTSPKSLSPTEGQCGFVLLES